MFSFLDERLGLEPGGQVVVHPHREPSDSFPEPSNS